MSATLDEDYYAVLGVPVGANDEQLRLAWRMLAARWHPDRAGLTATPFFQRLSCAYEVLSNPIARAAYDRKRGHTSRRTTTMTTAAQTQPPASKTSRAEAPGVMLSRLTGSLVSLLARGAAHLDEPGYVTLVLNQSEANQGGMVQVSLRVEVWCPECAARKRPPTGCARCEGKGTVEELFSAWLAVPPGVNTGEVLTPSAELPGMVEPVRFRVQVRPPSFKNARD